MTINSFDFVPNSVGANKNDISISAVYSVSSSTAETLDVSYSGDGTQVDVLGWTPSTRTIGAGATESFADVLDIKTFGGPQGKITLMLTGNSANAHATATIKIDSTVSFVIADMIAKNVTADNILSSKSIVQLRKILKRAGYSYDKSSKTWKIE
jgi:hypothetical protein